MVLLRNEVSWVFPAAMSVFYLMFQSSIICSSVYGQFSDDRMALLEFKDSVSDPYGILQSWSADSFNYCSWFGVSCHSNLRVSRLEINGRNCSQMNGKLIGRFSGILGNLRDLKVLSLPFNELHGAVPVEIWGLRNLEVLDLQGNHLDGDFSSFNFTGLRRLRVLNLASNEFSGLFPASLSKCKGLRILNLANNAINDVVPGFITSFKRLKVINLSFNRLCGYVPSYSGYCTNLKHLDLSNNFLKGNIPRSLGSCLQLRTLLLSSNALDGAIPPELGDLRSLEVLDVSRNFLRGPIPLDLGNCTNLSILVLSRHSTTLSRRQHPHGDSSYRENSIRESCCCNSFNGSLPEEITALPNLKILWAPCAALSGNLPSNWGSCERLKMVNLAHNFLTGSFSSLITKCVDLQYLNLSYNMLNGRLDENPNALSVSKTQLPVHLSQDSVIAKMRTEISKHKGSLILGVSVFAAMFAALVVFCCINRNKAGVPVADLEPHQLENIAEAQTINHTNKLTIFNDIGVELTYESILEATENFNRRNCIGNGGFGSTYKAEVGAGCAVAVKRLMGERHQGASQMYAEVTTLGRINHPHLITLIGYYAGPTEMFLVYNYLSGGNLDRFITDRERRTFNFGILHKISLHIASSLSYLHDQCDPCVLHRDIKPSNILLDGDYNAYLSDFGLSKILPVATTHATTRVAGTYGYIAPEYAETGRVSDKVDVYSYGVVMLELLSDKRALDPSFSMHEHGFDITRWAKMMSRQGQYKDIFTARLWDSGPRDKLLKILSLAVLCTNHESAARPAMKQVVRRLSQL